MNKIIKYYLAKICTFIVSYFTALMFIAYAVYEYTDQIGLIIVPFLTYFISAFFVKLFKVEEHIDTKRVRISLMMESFFLYYWFFDLIYLIIPKYSNVSSLWNNLFIFSTIAYFVASGLHDLENIRQMQHKTPLCPVIFSILQVAGFLLSVVFSLVYTQGYYPWNTVNESIIQGILPTLLTLVFCVILFITAWKTHKVNIENSSVSLLQDYQSTKNKLLFRSLLIAIPIFVVVSLIIGLKFHHGKY
jgi:hypothetical protein